MIQGSTSCHIPLGSFWNLRSVVVIISKLLRKMLTRLWIGRRQLQSKSRFRSRQPVYYCSLQDFTGVPAVVDLAVMRDAMNNLGGDKINPLVPVDLVIDHSIQVDVTRSANAVQANMELEFQRNKERFAFLKWGSKASQNMLVVPPGSGIVQSCIRLTLNTWAVLFSTLMECSIPIVLWELIPTLL